MSIRVAINGFGRIGRLAFRRIKELGESTELEVVAVNDLTNKEDLAYLLKYDSAHGVFPYTVEMTDIGFVVGDNEVRVFEEKDANNLPWRDLGIDLVIESTGFYTTKEKANAHLNAGAKKVMITAPPKDDTKIAVYGVNEESVSSEDKIISAASCTTTALALVTDVLVKEFGIKRGLMTGSRAYTATQSLQDSPGGRKNRAGAQNVIPSTTGAAKALGKVIPEVDGIIDGTSTRVPVITAGFAELYLVLDRDVTIDEINDSMKKAANESLGYTEEEVVSSDIVGTTHGSVFDATLTDVMNANGGQLVKIVAWYDNEYGFAANMIRLVEYFTKNS